MKKLVILMLVLGMVTAANAALSGTVTGTPAEDTTITAVALDVTGAAQSYVAIAIQGTGVLSGYSAGADAPPDAGLVYSLADLGLSALGQGELWIMANIAVPTGYVDGEWLTAIVTGAVEGDIILAYELTGSMGSTLLDSFTVTPEPITIALLGLGGLFIRRKK